jgi:protein-disulfide isomerase
MIRWLMLPLAWALCVGAPSMARAADAIDPAQVEQIEKVIRDYLLKNPEVIIQAVRGLEERQKREAQEMTRELIGKHGKELRQDPDSFVAGNPKGDVTIVEFFDYRCGYCKQVHPVVKNALRADGKVRLVMKEFPVLGPESVAASRAAVAAFHGQRDKYLAFHDAMMERRGTINDAVIMEIAATVGLNVEKLKTDMKSAAVERTLRENYKLAQTLGINGTPAFIIGDELVPGAIIDRQMMQLIAQARQGCMTC